MRMTVPILIAGLLALPVIAGDDDFVRERSGRDPKKDAAKDSLEGKSPPALQVQGWLNTEGKALTWADFRGKVVVIDFWGTW